MGPNPWDEVENQREGVIDSPPKKLGKFIESFTKRDFFEEAFSWGGPDNDSIVIPTTYYTKPSAWASDYALTYRRVLVFINPSHFKKPQIKSLDDYIKWEFGCSRATFVKQVADGWVFPMLTLRDAYPKPIQREMVELFDEINDYNGCAIPRYVNLVDDAFGAAVLENGADTDGYAMDFSAGIVDVTSTYKKRAELLPWVKLPEADITPWGVPHENFREYVVERVTKLELAVNVLDDVQGIAPKVEALKRRVRNYDNDEEDLEPLLLDTYTAWNLLGTPMYYCDFSGRADMGQTVAKSYGGLMRQLFTRAKSRVTDMSKLMSYANREYDASHDVAFFDVCGLDMDDLFGVSPENQDPKGNVEGEHRARIEAHDRYYSELRDDLLDRREKGHSSYKEVIREHNHLVNSSRNRGNIVFGNARRAISWGSDLVGISTIVDAPSLPEEMRKTIAAGYVGTKAAALLGNIVAYSGQRKANRYQLPAPDFAKEINLGKMDYWQLEYNRDRYRDRVLQFLTGASD